METSYHDRMLQILGEALELPEGPDRRAFLDRACADDARLRADVDRLLGVAHEAADRIPTENPHELISFDALKPPEQIGPYKIIRELGHGGMGAVYLAMQNAPVRRAVAIKLLLPGMDSRVVLSRFESERQALAIMNHPNVAVFFDAGATEQGRPFFAMEFVDGVPITQYCDEHRLTTSQRIELFLPVCEAVQHAHQKAIIHRDIKPTNVLVTVVNGKPVPKVIDFGIAKATDQRTAERSMFTEHGQLVGTPEYMSPEQASPDAIDIDTRSDVYSLGVLLYQLVTGALPFDSKSMRESAYEEIRRIIREVEPPKPSTRVSSLGALTKDVAAARRAEPHEHRNLLRGELDWITMRAIEKDRSRRYSSPADLAADLSRHLRDEPVLAGPPSQWYRAKKLVARHRTVAAFVSLLMISLIAGIATTTWQARVAKRERTAAVEQRTLAEKRTADIRKLASTLIFDIDGAIQNAGPTKAREQLAETAREYLDQLSAESPDDGLLKDVVNGYLRLGIVQYYPGFAHLGQPVAAEASFAKGLDLAKKRYAANAGESYAHADVGRLHIYHARALRGLNRHDEALAELDEAKKVFEALSQKEPANIRWPRNVAIVLDHRSQVFEDRGEGTSALEALRQVREIYERLEKQSPEKAEQIRDVMIAHSGLAVLLMNSGLPCEAIEHARQSSKRALDLVAREPANPQYQRDAFNEQLMLCQTLLTAGFGSEPMKIMPAIVDARRKVWKNDPSNYLALRDIATALRVYGDALHTTGRVREGIAAQTESLALHDELVKLDPKDTFIFNQIANVERSLASMLLDAGELDRALEHAKRAVTIHQNHSKLSLANSKRVLAEVLLARNELAKAVEQLDDAAKVYAIADGKPAPDPADRREYVFICGVSCDAKDMKRNAEGTKLAADILKIGAQDLTIAWWNARMHLRRADAEKAQADALATQAEKAMRDAIALDPATFFFRQTLAQALTVRAEIARANNDSTTARSRFNAALAELATLQQQAPDLPGTARAIASIQAQLQSIR